ncbi:MAG TPA: ATP-binding cassette domain-containing protein, partial [Planctomycetota bacterium]|nr:ATP-binding cassette domain-containing protein [Planctomycetota bacterium]
STTMKILTGFIPPTSGSATVAGFDVAKQSLDVRRRVGYLPENNPLYTEMRVAEYLSFRATLRQVPAARRRPAVDSALERCGLTDVRNRIVGHLSKGFRQRIGIADAFVHDPEIVILDEPTIGLDPNQIRHIRKVIRELGKDRTVILSTHILSEVEKMCSRVLIISRGKMISDGTPAEILKKTATGRIRLDIGGEIAGVREALQRIHGVENVVEASLGAERSYFIEAKNPSTVMPEIIRRASEGRWNVLELGPERLSLEDAFFELTDHKGPVPDLLHAAGGEGAAP